MIKITSVPTNNIQKREGAMRDLLGKKFISTALAIIIVLASVGYFAIQSKLKEPIEDKITQIQRDLAGIGELEYDKVTVSPITRKASVKGVEFYDYGTEQVVNVGSINILSLDMGSQIPKFLSLSFNDIAIDFSKWEEREIQALREQGFVDFIHADFNIDYVYDPEQKQLDLNTLAFKVEELGLMTLSLSLGNVNLTPEGIVSLIFTWPNIVFRGGEIHLENDGIVELAMKEEAESLGMSYSDYHKKFLRDGKKMLDSLPPGRVKSARESVYDFLENPQNITVSAYPDRPVQIQRIIQVSDEDRQFDLLSLEVSS